MVDKYDLLELFESEPQTIDEEAGMYKYTKQDAYGFTLELSLFLYDRWCSLTLEHKDLKTFIFNLSFDWIDTIEAKNDKLVITQDNVKQKTVIYFKPNYTLAFEDPIE